MKGQDSHGGYLCRREPQDATVVAYLDGDGFYAPAAPYQPQLVEPARHSCNDDGDDDDDDGDDHNDNDDDDKNR